MLVLCSTTHNGVQLMLGIYQEGNWFTLVEMRIHYQYTWAESRILRPCQFQVFCRWYWFPCNLAVVKVILSMQLTLSYCLLVPIKQKGLGVCNKCRLKNTVRSKHIGSRAYSWLIKLGQTNPLFRWVRANVGCCKSFDTLLQGILLVCRGVVGLFRSSSQQGRINFVLKMLYSGFWYRGSIKDTVSL